MGALGVGVVGERCAPKLTANGNANVQQKAENDWHSVIVCFWKQTNTAAEPKALNAADKQ